MGINAPGYSNKKSLIWPWNSRILYRRKKSRNDVILAQLLSKVKGKCKLPWNRLFCSLHKLLSSASKDLGQSTSFIMDSLACDVKFHNLWASSIPGSPNREAMSSDLLDSLKRLWWCRLCLAEKLRMIPIDVILNLFCKMIHIELVNSRQILNYNQNINKKLERWLVGLEFRRENNQNKRNFSVKKRKKLTLLQMVMAG